MVVGDSTPYVPLSVSGNIIEISSTPVTETLLGDRVEELTADLDAAQDRIQDLEAEIKMIRERAKIEIDNRLLSAHLLALDGKGDSEEACRERGAYFIFYNFLDAAGQEWARGLYSTLEAERDEMHKGAAWAKEVLPETKTETPDGR